MSEPKNPEGGSRKELHTGKPEEIKMPYMNSFIEKKRLESLASRDEQVIKDVKDLKLG